MIAEKATGKTISTAPDLVRMIKSVYTGDLISSGLKTQMLTPPAINVYQASTPSTYGFGINVASNGLTMDEGANPGYNAIMALRIPNGRPGPAEAGPVFQRKTKQES
jgi:hypothetical protein